MEIHLHELNMTFGEHKVLVNVNIDLSDIKSLVIIGPSGGGKTTLLRILAGLQQPTSGTIKINNHELNFEESSIRTYRSSIGMVFQAYNLFPHLTALQNITLPLIKVHKQSTEEAEERAYIMLKRFQLEEHALKKPSQLSGGQKQRIAISRAAALSPEVLLFDEPTSALDPEFTAEVLDLIRDLSSDGMELIMVTHEMGFARHVAEHILFIADGDICDEGSPMHIFEESQNQSVRQFLNKVLKY